MEIDPRDYLFQNRKSNKRNRTTLDPPKMIGYFSVNENRQFLYDASRLKYLKMPGMENVYFDLNKGITDFCPKPESVKKEKMNFMLKFILENIELLKVKSNFDCHQKLLNADVICSRGKLTKIICSNSEKWSLTVSKYKGNIYICQPDGDDDGYTLQTAYGFKFEQYMMSESPFDDPDTDVPVIESNEFYCVFRSNVSNISLLYNAEMDGLVSDVEVDLKKINFDELKFVEIKSCVVTKNLEPHYCKWWAQSFLAKVENIVVGYRQENGIVFKIDSKVVSDLAKTFKVNWSPGGCIDLLKSFLSFLKLLLRHVDCPYTVYKFDYDPKVNKTIQYKVFKGRNEYSFLPDWYVNAMDIQSY